MSNQKQQFPFDAMSTTRYDGFPVKAGREGNREEILQAIKGTLAYMWRVCHKRLTICHYTVNLPGIHPEEANDVLSNALQSFKQAMRRKKTKFEYLWVREIGALVIDKRPHYQLFCLFDGKSVQSAYTARNHLNSLLSKRMGVERNCLHINDPQNNSFQLAMKVSEELGNYADAFNWLSYLAKKETKDAPAYQKTFSYSKGFLNDHSEPESNVDVAGSGKEALDISGATDSALDVDALIAELLGKVSSKPSLGTGGIQTAEQAVGNSACKERGSGAF